jgi:hypothetical protein
MVRFGSLFWTFFACLAWITAAAGQTARQAPSQAASQPDPVPTPTPAPRVLRRWLDVEAAGLSLRFRARDSQGVQSGSTSPRELQHKEAFRLRLKLDPRGRYGINAGLFSGTTFTSSWNNTGLGTGSGVGALHVKQLFADAHPIDGLDLQGGSLYFWRGESSEGTSYDDDGYVMGERVIVHRPDRVFFDEIVVTHAFLGDVSRVNVFDRLDRIDEVNYRQAGVLKTIGTHASTSIDYTVHAHLRTLRAGLYVRTPALRAIDAIRVDGYRRFTGEDAGGFATLVEKAVAPRVTIGGGFATIDRGYGGLNSDRYNIGKRMLVNASVALSDALTLGSYFTRAIDNDYPVANHKRFDVALTYNLLKTLQRAHVVPPQTTH